MRLQYVGSFFEACGLRGGDEVFGSHYFVDEALRVALEAEVAVCHDAHELAVVIDNGYAADVVFAHHAEGVGHGGAATNGHGVVNHAVFGAFHGVYLTGLFCYRHIFMNHAKTALARYGYSELGFCNGVHSRRYDGYVQCDVAGKTRGKRNFARKHFGISRYEQDVVEGKTVHLYSVCNKRHKFRCVLNCTQR